MKNRWYRCLWLGLIATAGAFAQSSDLSSAGNEAGSIAYASYQGTSIATVSQGVRVWSFTVNDDALSDPDSDPTVLYEITIRPGSGNVANWGSTIRAAALFRGTTLVAPGTLSGNSLYFVNAGGSDNIDTVADNGSKTFSLYLTFKGTVTDNETMRFQLDAADVTPDTFFGPSSTLGPSATASSASGASVNKIEVVADRLQLQGVPTSVYPATDFSSTVVATDVLGNTDANATGSVTLSRNAGSAVLTSVAGLTKSLSSGSAAWSDLQLDVENFNVRLIATHSGSYLTDSSDAFVVTGAILVENFEYVTNADLTASGWTQVGGISTNPIKTTGASLTASGYPGSGVGVAAYLQIGTGQDVYRSFTTASSGALYISAMVKVTSVNTTGSYFYALALPSPSSSSDYRACIYAKQVSGNLAFGVSTAPEDLITYYATYTGGSYSFGTTHIVVAKYEFIPGTNNDVVKLWIDPNLSGPEPSATLTAATPPSDYDAASLGAVALRQDGSTPDCDIDGIRVASTWGEAPLPVQLSSFTVASSGLSAALKWTTSTERDNAGFELERRSISEVGMRNTEYTKVGFVAGSGTSTSPREYSFIDAGVAPGRYAYRIKQVDRDGAYTLFREAEVEIGQTAKAFALNEAFPNPFNPSTSLDFRLAEAGLATVKVYDLLGREVATIFNGAAEAGRLYRATWDASLMPSGMYFARLESGGMSAMKRLMLVK